MDVGEDSHDDLRSDNQADEGGPEGSGNESPEGSGSSPLGANQLPEQGFSDAAGEIARKLQPTYRLHLQEAFRVEKDPSKLNLYMQLIESEAQREAGIYAKQFSVNAQMIRSQTFSASLGIVLSSIFEFAKWCAPAGLALYCTFEIALFFTTANKDAAAAFEKILYVLVTGTALGWAVSKKEK